MQRRMRRRLLLGAAQAEDQLFDLCFPQPFHGAQVCEDAGTWRVPLGRIPKRFDDLDVPVDLLAAFLLEGPDKHTTTIPSTPLLSSEILHMYVLQRREKNRKSCGLPVRYPEIRGR